MRDLFRQAVTYVFAPLAFFMSYSAPAAQEIALLIDNSGSMRKNDPHSLTKQAVAQFVQNSPGGSRVALIKFDRAVEVLSPLTPMNETTRMDMLAQLDRINFKGPLTNSGEALKRALEELKHQGDPAATKTVVFMTDGIVDTGSRARDRKTAETMRTELVQTAVDSGIRIFSIAFTDNADTELMQDLAERTGGMYFQPKQPGDLAGVFTEMSDLFVAETSTPPVEAAGATKTPGPASEKTKQQPTATEPLAIAGAPQGSQAPSEAVPDPSLGGPTAQLPALPATPPDWAKTLPPDETSVPEASIPAWNMGWIPVFAVGTVGFTLFLSVVSVVLLYKLYSGPRRGGTGLGFLEKLSADPAPRALLYCGQLSRESPHEPDDGVFDVTGGPTRIGRAPGPGGLVIPGKGISREHAVVEYRDYAYWVIDQGSANGTFVNNKPVGHKQRLHHGDRVRFNETDFLFLLPGREEADATVLVPLEHSAAQAVG